MNKIVLIDGNNILFRSYYATAYSGSLMKNSKGEPTNALYGLINMLNKIINEEKPTHIMIAFDKGKTFRHDKYLTYKAGRSEMPDELKKQFLVAYDLVTSMGIKYLMVDNYEADDIIGTFARMVDESDNFEGLIVSSDKDLLQLISEKVKVKLLKNHDEYIMMDKEKFKEIYGLSDPKRIVDLKSLMGDSSDNIPGVKGIGEKTALSLLQKYETLDGVYNNLSYITGKTKEKLALDKENAYMSYDIATIYRMVPVLYSLEDLIYTGPDKSSLIKNLNDLEFYSLLKKIDLDNKKEKLVYQKITNLLDLKLDGPYSIYLEVLGYNYHDSTPLGVSIKTKTNLYYVPFDLLKDTSIFLDNQEKYTYDLKKLLVVFHKYNIKIDKKINDLMLITYLLNKNIRNDIAYLANSYKYDITFYDKLYGSELTIKYPSNESYIGEVVKKANFIYLEYNNILEELNINKLDKL